MQNMITAHEQCWDDIPWLVNGRIGAAEQQRLLAHVAECAQCREELQQQRELQAHLCSTPADCEIPQASWDELAARIEAQPQRAPAPVPERTRRPQTRQWWVAAVWAQGVAIAVLLAALLASEQRAEYVTLSTPAPMPERGSVRVVFAPDASLTRVNSLLREIGCEVVAGPSEAGVYTIAVTKADPASAIAALRQHREVVFAESTAASASQR